MLAVGNIEGGKSVFNLCILLFSISRTLRVKMEPINTNTGHSNFENSDMFGWPFRMILNIQEKCVPVKELAQASLLI